MLDIRALSALSGAALRLLPRDPARPADRACGAGRGAAAAAARGPCDPCAGSLGNAGLGTYHSGVEWGFWQGPTDCTGPVVNLGSAGDLLSRLDTVKVVRCDEVQWRFLGLSLAGYNVLISLLDGCDRRVGNSSATRSAEAQSSTSSCVRPNRCTMPGVAIVTKTKRER